MGKGRAGGWEREGGGVSSREEKRVQGRERELEVG